jgi:hypothetical protein
MIASPRVAWSATDMAKPARKFMTVPVCATARAILAVVLSFATISSAGAQQRAALVEVVRFGGDADDPSSVASPGHIAVASDGSIVVSDATPLQLKVFSADGKFLRNVGRTGEGPGEYRSINAVTITSQGYIAVLDMQLSRMTYFTLAGSLVTTTRLPALTCCRLDGTVTPTAEILDELHSRTPIAGVPRGHTALRRIAASGTIRDTIHMPACVAAPGANAFVRLSLQSGGYMVTRVPLQPSPQIAYTSDSGAWCTPSDRYVIYRFATGRSDTLHTITRPVQGPMVSDSLRRRIMTQYANATIENGTRFSAAALPARLPAIADIAVDASGRLWVRRTETPADAPSFDVYGEDRRTRAHGQRHGAVARDSVRRE